MFEPKVKLRRGLFEKLETTCAKLGCTVEEFVERCVEAELERTANQPGNSQALSSGEVENIVGQLKGLGYLE